MNYLYLRPSRNVLRGRPVTSLAGTPDADHQLAWLTDDRLAFPARWEAGAWAASISVAAQDVRLVALANTSVDATVTVGGMAGSMAAGALGENGVRFNPYLLNPVATAGVTAVTFSGNNAAPTIIGEAFAGVPEELLPFRMGTYWEEPYDGGVDELGGNFMNLPPHDEGREWRRFGGSQLYNEAQQAQVMSLWRDQRAMSRPSLLVMDETVNDARVVVMRKPRFQNSDRRDLAETTIEFIELPRYRWP